MVIRLPRVRGASLGTEQRVEQALNGGLELPGQRGFEGRLQQPHEAPAWAHRLRRAAATDGRRLAVLLTTAACNEMAPRIGPRPVPAPRFGLARCPQ